MSTDTVICSECGKRMTKETHSQAFVIGELSLLAPIFCSPSCAARYDPTNLTLAKFDGIRQWLPVKPPCSFDTNATLEKPKLGVIL